MAPSMHHWALDRAMAMVYAEPISNPVLEDSLIKLWQQHDFSELVPSGPFQFLSLMRLSDHAAAALENRTEKGWRGLFSNPPLLNVHTSLTLPLRKTEASKLLLLMIQLLGLGLSLAFPSPGDGSFWEWWRLSSVGRMGKALDRADRRIARFKPWICSQLTWNFPVAGPVLAHFKVVWVTVGMRGAEATRTSTAFCNVT